MEQPEIMTMQEAAKHLRLSLRGLYYALEENPELKTFKVGRRRFIRRDVVNQWVQSQEASK